MSNIDRALHEFREIDELADGNSPVHHFSASVKLAVTVVYILVVVSFPRYALSALSVMVLYPVLMFQLSGISVGTCFHKLRLILPLVIFVGLFNPFFDRTPLFRLGSLVVTGGMISMITLMMKGIFCLMASFLLAATTKIDALCASLRKLHVPSVLVTLLLLTYRYISVMIEEVSVMNDAYHLRAPGQKGIHYSAWGSFLGQLLLRSMDRAQELYSSMLLRGYRGEFHYAETKKTDKKDILFLLACISMFLLARNVDIAAWLGNLTVR